MEEYSTKTRKSWKNLSQKNPYWKQKKTRSKAHIDAFSKCQARRREIIQNKMTVKTPDIKNEPVNKTVKNLEKNMQ